MCVCVRGFGPDTVLLVVLMIWPSATLALSLTLPVAGLAPSQVAFAGSQWTMVFCAQQRILAISDKWYLLKSIDAGHDKGICFSSPRCAE